jgi:hypothetical protein
MVEYAGGHVSPLVLNKIKPWNLLEQVGLQSNCRLIFFLEAARLGHQLNVCQCLPLRLFTVDYYYNTF